MTIWIYSGDRPSHGAKALSALAGFKRLRTGKYLKPKDIIINWGSSNADYNFMPVKLFLNRPELVSGASNKLHAFEIFDLLKVKCVPWTVDHAVVDQWHEKGCTIVGRQTLTGHSGKGIIIMEKGEPIQPALLYTKYIFKIREFRVHVVNGKVIDTQQKIKEPGKEPLTWKVRSHENGFIFARQNIMANDTRDTLSIMATKALGLDFGAVDIVEDKEGHFYVLEVNTAPGLEGQTISNYAEAFKQYDS